MRTRTTRRYVWGDLTIDADYSDAAATIRYAIDDDELQPAPYQVADARHQPSNAFRMVRDYLRSTGGW